MQIKHCPETLKTHHHSVKIKKKLICLLPNNMVLQSVGCHLLKYKDNSNLESTKNLTDSAWTECVCFIIIII